jgi:hypothetical protein
MSEQNGGMAILRKNFAHIQKKFSSTNEDRK